MQTRAMPEEREMWRAVLERDRSYDGLFVTAVRTTGIFCRPSCPARKPRLENVEFMPDPRAALRAGYRPCQRCRPLDRSGTPPDWVRLLLERIERAPGQRIADADLRALSIDPARARRYFQSHYGMTFHAYQRARRLGDALAHLRRGGRVDAAGGDSGFASSSGFREAFHRLFGQSPARSGEVCPLVVQWLDTPIGPFVAGATDEGVCFLEFADRRALERQIEVLRRRFGSAALPGRHRHLDQLKAELDEYFAQERREFTVPLVTQGTPFQESVWQGLQRIPYGQTCSYDQLARAIGRPGAQRAVGRANGENRLAIVVPCHRVIGRDGRLTGYGGGLWRKALLLELEGATIDPRDRAAHRPVRASFGAFERKMNRGGPRRATEKVVNQ